MLQCSLNNVRTQLEIDTGSYLSTVNLNLISKLDKIQIQKTSVKAKGYSGNVIDLVGKIVLNVKYDNLEVYHEFFIVNNLHATQLMGRDLCEKLMVKIGIPNERVCSVKSGVLREFSDYLSESFSSCVTRKVCLKVKENVQPIFCKARTIPLKFKALVKIELERLEKCGVITRVYESSWATPIVCALKSNGKIRLCGDYSVTLNRVMHVVQYPLPTIENVIAQMGNAKVFSRLDLQNAYLQLPLEEESKLYTTINSEYGLFRYNYLPFGVSSSPGLFQSFICSVLSGIENIVAYQDDILVSGESTESHDCTLRLVLQRLKEAGVKLNTGKCRFFLDTVTFLGYNFSSKGIQPCTDKIKAILDAPSPTNVMQVQSFIGICTFYSKFIPQFSNRMAPLYSLTKKGTKFVWGSDQMHAFENIKSSFKQANLLRFFNPNLQTALETDSSSYGIGAVILQKHADGWHPVQFASRTLSRAEQNYSQIEREALSVVFGVERFKTYLLGIKFELRNDHKPLEKLFSNNSGVPSRCSPRIQRWALRLSMFRFNFRYIKGKENLTSDFLSRLPLQEEDSCSEPYELIFTLNCMNRLPITSTHIAAATKSDRLLSLVTKYVKHGFPNVVESCLRKYKEVSNELSLNEGCIMYRDRVVIPVELRGSVLKLFHNGHPGINVMKAIARSLIWYPGLDSDIENIVRNCKQCVEHRNKPPKSNVKWPETRTKWSRIHVDHFFLEDCTFFLVIDSFSKYIECEIVSSTSTQDTIDCLKGIFSRNGIPDVLVSDNATCFTSYQFKEFLETLGVQHITPPPYSPSSNGQAEVAVRIIKNLLKKSDGGKLKHRLYDVLLHYRTIPQSTTGVCPAKLLNGRNYSTLKQKINPLYRPKNEESSENVREFRVGDAVYALNLHSGPKWYKGTITEKLGVNVYKAYIHDLGMIWKRHSNQLLASSLCEKRIVLPLSSGTWNSENASSSDLDNQPEVLEPRNTPESTADDSAVSEELPLRRSSRNKRPPDRYSPQ